MRLSDLIASSILDLLDEQNGVAEIQRNELAGKIGCVPSQINYVITSRFTPEQGYIVESRRGGGGYIRITRVQLAEKVMLMHMVNSIGDSIDYNSARINIENLQYQHLLEDKMAEVMLSAISDKALHGVAVPYRDQVRACILKNMLLASI